MRTRLASLLFLCAISSVGCLPAADTASATPAETATVTPTTIPTETPRPTPSPTPVSAPEGYRLVWNDEFDGAILDGSNWTLDLGGGGWGNGEMEYYTSRSENVRLAEGMLVIEAHEEKYEGEYYTSARIKTQGLHTFRYGLVEARMKVPAGAGLWPAFWMLGVDPDGSRWPDCGEIDIMEHIGREPDLILGTIHGPGYSGDSGLSTWYRQDYDIADDFHTYAIEWKEDQIAWFYDGEEYAVVTPEDLGDREWVFTHPFFIILNLAVGGRLPGPVSPHTVFPAQLYVDYVRVYQEAP